MPLTVRKNHIKSAKELFEKCGLSEAYQHACELKKKRIPYSAIREKQKKIGTFDATSCLGVVYQTQNGLFVQHVDGRPLDVLLTIFSKSSPIKVTMIGGCKNGNGYAHLEKNTKENLEKLVSFWLKHHFTIDVQTWALGEGDSYQTLCSDFVADENGIYLINQGEIGLLNLEMHGRLIPQTPRRMADTFIDQSKYFFVCDGTKKQLSLPALKKNPHLLDFADAILKFDEHALLQHCSTTPTLEPPYFPQMIRAMATFLLNQQEDLAPLTVSLLEDQPAFALQGEIIKL